MEVVGKAGLRGVCVWCGRTVKKCARFVSENVCVGLPAATVVVHLGQHPPPRAATPCHATQHRAVSSHATPAQQHAHTAAHHASHPQVCPPELASLIERCWAAAPHARPSCSEVVGDLEVQLAAANAAYAATAAMRRQTTHSISLAGALQTAGTAVQGVVPAVAAAGVTVTHSDGRGSDTTTSTLAPASTLDVPSDAPRLMQVAISLDRPPAAHPVSAPVTDRSALSDPTTMSNQGPPHSS